MASDGKDFIRFFSVRELVDFVFYRPPLRNRTNAGTSWCRLCWADRHAWFVALKYLLFWLSANVGRWPEITSVNVFVYVTIFLRITTINITKTAPHLLQYHCTRCRLSSRKYEVPNLIKVKFISRVWKRKDVTVNISSWYYLFSHTSTKSVGLEIKLGYVLVLKCPLGAKY